MLRCVLLQLMLAGALVSQTPPAAEASHRFDYPAEHFSIELPQGWTELDAATARLLGSVGGQLLPNGPKVKFNHVYTPSDLSTCGLFIAMADFRLTDAAFKDLDGTTRAMNDAVKRVFSGSPAQMSLQAENMSYDKERHLLLATTAASSVLSGQMRSVIGAYLTSAGTIQLNCYAKAPEFEKYEEECRRIIRSVTIDPSITLKPPVPLSDLLKVEAVEANFIYRDLVARVRRGDSSVDFRALRMACVRSNVCDVRATPEDLAAMNQAQKEQRHDDAIEKCETLVDQGFVNIDAHATCSQAYATLKKPEQAKFHMGALIQLLQSILNSGDGKSEQTAYEAISVREVWATLTARGLPYTGASVLSHRTITAGDHKYEIYNVRDPKTQANVVVFFNVDAEAARAR